MNYIDIDRIDLNYPLPAGVFQELPFSPRFKARWLDLKEMIEASLPRTFFWCSMLLRQKRFNLMVTSMPTKPKEGQRWTDTTSGEVRRYEEGKWKVVRTAS